MQRYFPNHEAQLVRLNKIEGQIAGVRKMIEERRYCVDIINQIRAVTAALKKVELGVLETHVHHCVREAAAGGNPELLEEKVAELVRVLGKVE